MTAIGANQLFEYALQECERHQTRMQQALAALKSILPFDAKRVESMDEESVRASDQFILRFTKLQDAMGSRLYPAILRVLGEPAEEMPMLDRLHRLEKLDIIPQAQQWQVLREIRNRLAHEYPDAPEKTAAAFNAAIGAAEELSDLLSQAEEQTRKLLGRT